MINDRGWFIRERWGTTSWGRNRMDGWCESGRKFMDRVMAEGMIRRMVGGWIH